MGWLVGKIKEYTALVKLMQPIAKLRLAILVFDGLWILFAVGFLFNYLCLSYFIFSALAMIMYIIGILIYRFR
jgi:hypothetical protein